jgi:hypothetical protein
MSFLISFNYVLIELNEMKSQTINSKVLPLGEDLGGAFFEKSI